MTRLTPDWVRSITETISDYDKYLKDITGTNLRDLAIAAADKKDSDITFTKNRNKAAVIRINTGEGVIDGFDTAVASILKQVGIDTILCENENAAGFNEAMDKNANILFMADDEKFIAVNTTNNRKSDNDYATALGFVTALEKMGGSITDKDIAILGYGKIGSNATDIINRKGGKVWLYDRKDLSRTAAANPVGIINKIEEISDYKYIFDSTNEGSWITQDIPIMNSYIAAPGIPLSFDINHFEKNNTILHDMLQIGTAVMLAEVL